MDFDVLFTKPLTWSSQFAFNSNKNFGPNDDQVIFSKLPAINGFEKSLPVAVCSGLVNS
jgi:hypothetical protein